MSNISIEAWKSVTQAQQKYDYFVVGLSSTLFAYLGAKYTPEPLSFSQNSFELAALTLLLAATIFGILRLETDIAKQSTDYHKAEAQERLRAVNKIISLPYTAINSDTGAPINSAEIEEQQKILSEFIEKVSLGLKKQGGRYEFYFVVRNIFLILGFVTLVIAKFVGVYFLTNTA